MNGNRVKNSILNILTGFMSRGIVMILGIISRTVFIRTLGNDYLSVNGLYSNILSLLSLAELGFGSAMVYSMYRPLAVGDQEKLSGLISLYRRVYSIIGIAIFAIGLCIIPFLDWIIQDPPNISNLTLYYVMFLCNTSLSYWFFAYKASLLIADQKTYILNNTRNIIHVIKTAFQIIVLWVFHDYLLYLITNLAFTVIENYSISFIVNKKYYSIIHHKCNILEASEKKRIWADVRGLTLIKIGHVILNSTDNIIITRIVGLYWVGLLSNYYLFVDAITAILCQISSSIQASLGNYFAENNPDKSYKLFKRIEFFHSWAYAFCSIMICACISPFINLWIGSEYVLSPSIIIAISINFYVQGYMNTLSTFRSALGLFTQGWIRPIVVSILNIALSIFLGKVWGVFGVLISTFISRALVNLWYDPLVIHKYGFHRSVIPFYKEYIKRIIVTGSICGISLCIRLLLETLNINTMLLFVIQVLCIACIFIFAFIILYGRSDEYKYWRDFILNTIFKRSNQF